MRRAPLIETHALIRAREVIVSCRLLLLLLLQHSIVAPRSPLRRRLATAVVPTLPGASIGPNLERPRALWIHWAVVFATQRSSSSSSVEQQQQYQQYCWELGQHFLQSKWKSRLSLLYRLLQLLLGLRRAPWMLVRQRMVHHSHCRLRRCHDYYCYCDDYETTDTALLRENSSTRARRNGGARRLCSSSSASLARDDPTRVIARIQRPQEETTVVPDTFFSRSKSDDHGDGVVLSWCCGLLLPLRCGAFCCCKVDGLMCFPSVSWRIFPPAKHRRVPRRQCRQPPATPRKQGAPRVCTGVSNEDLLLQSCCPQKHVSRSHRKIFRRLQHQLGLPPLSKKTKAGRRASLLLLVVVVLIVD